MSWERRETFVDVCVCDHPSYSGGLVSCYQEHESKSCCVVVSILILQGDRVCVWQRKWGPAEEKNAAQGTPSFTGPCFIIIQGAVLCSYKLSSASQHISLFRSLHFCPTIDHFCLHPYTTPQSMYSCHSLLDITHSLYDIDPFTPPILIEHALYWSLQNIGCDTYEIVTPIACCCCVDQDQS